MSTNRQSRRELWNNLAWFAVSLVLAFVVWWVATNENDPVSERIISQREEILVMTDPGLIVVDQSRETVTVTARAQSSVLSLLEPDDVTIVADVVGRGAGMHVVELDATVTRRAILDVSPRQITVTLEQLQSQQIPVNVQIPDTRQPPAGYRMEAPQLSHSQVLVSGPASQVEQVVAVRAMIDLRDQRTTLNTTVRLSPVNADGAVISDVELEPQSIDVTVVVNRRDDVREVPVRPDIDVLSLESGYTLSIGYQPQTVVVTGPSGQLTELPDTLLTERIDLADRTEDFEIQVPVDLPGDSLQLLGEQRITVSISLTAQTTTKQLEGILVNIIGLDEATLEVDTVTNQVTALVDVPEPIADQLTSDTIRVVVDLNGLAPGTYELEPLVTSTLPNIQPEDIRVLPDVIAVTIRSLAEATADPS